GGAQNGILGFGCGPSDNDALLFVGWAPNSAFITNSTFKESAAGGIVSGWSDANQGPNLAEGNAFENIANGRRAAGPAPASGSATCPHAASGCFCAPRRAARALLAGGGRRLHRLGIDAVALEAQRGVGVLRVGLQRGGEGLLGVVVLLLRLVDLAQRDPG